MPPGSSIRSSWISTITTSIFSQFCHPNLFSCAKLEGSAGFREVLGVWRGGSWRFPPRKNHHWFNFQAVMLTQEHSGTTIHQQQGEFSFKHHKFSHGRCFLLDGHVEPEFCHSSITEIQAPGHLDPRCLCVDARQKRCLPGLGIGYSYIGVSCVTLAWCVATCNKSVTWKQVEKVPPNIPKRRSCLHCCLSH